ncbi:MAG: Ig-like domain-containing protein [Candidatus Brocadia sp.]
MKFNRRLLRCIFLIFVQACFLSGVKFIPSTSADESWKNFYGICWNGDPNDHITYAKQMGYDYIALTYGQWDKNQYANNPNRDGLKFYLVDPHVLQDMVPIIGKLYIDTTRSYTQEQRDFFERNMVWKSMEPFPRNIETGWHFSATDFRPNWDFQQQRVIDYVIEQFITIAKSYEDQSIGFTCAGYMVDVPKLSGEFAYYDLTKNNRNTFVTLSYWTGVDSGLLHDGITHEYATYTEGRAAFFKQLNARMRQEFPDTKWILEPYHLYSETATDEWIYQIKDRADKGELTPDMLTQESSSTNFVDNDSNFNSGVNVTRDMVGISQPNSVGEYENRFYAAKAGINWAWYNWFGRFGGTGDMPKFASVTEVYPRLKLIRCLPNWDNLNNVPLDYRSWDGSVYQSTKSYASSDVIYSRHPKTGKLFAVFITQNGTIRLNPGETVTSVQRTDGYFRESEDGSADVTIMGDQITLNPGVAIDVDSTNNQVKGNGYIFTIESDGKPQCTTGLATNVTSNTATINGLVNANGLSTTAWFEFGVTNGSYDSSSPLQSISGSDDTAMNFSINGLPEATNCYYRVVARNSAGTTYGNEKFFTTLDVTAPNCSIAINNGANYSNSRSVTLSLEATDNVGVTGYYLSTSSVIPLASAAGWTAISSTTNYNANVSYTLSSGDGNKTLYVWYKDAVGNVSNTSSDSIILDTTGPSITITSPTSYATYKTANNTISLGGTASDNASGVGRVTWSNNRGGSGTASGTTSWSISDISLLLGDNIITVTATDGAGNTMIDTITVSYQIPPNGSISINGGAAYTNSIDVTLTLSATDDVGVTGYYLSTSSTRPQASATGWTTISSTTSYNANVSYTLSDWNGNKTVYVWYKDAAGNVSNTFSDSITLDKTNPGVTIKSPTTNANYTTTSSTITLGGTASDNLSGVFRVTWSNDKGGSGTASGTANWSTNSIWIAKGTTVFTVTAIDRANNKSTDTITVTRN